MSQVTNLKSRDFRKLIVQIGMTLVFLALFIFMITGARELMLPTILGAFLGYLFRPMVGLITGPPIVKFAKCMAMLLAIGAGIYISARSITTSLPNEKEQLELLVRLQYRINLRYHEWMGITAENPKGNWIHGLAGKEFDPLIKQVNQFLSLDQEQRKTFMLYRKGHNDMTPVSDTYYNYFLANLQAMKESQEAAALESASLSSTATVGAPEAPTKAPGAGVAQLIKMISIWIVFPLVFIFVLLDKGQIQQFFLKLIPNRYFELSRTIMDEVDEALGHYIRGTLIECLCVGVTISIGLWLCGFAPKFFILVGVVGGITNAIPFVGTALALILGCAVALIAENLNPILPFINLNNLFLGVIAVVTFAHILDNAVFQPVIVGGAVHIHPLAVILGVFAGSLTFGFAGLLLAIPSIVILKVVTETLFHELKAYKII